MLIGMTMPAVDFAVFNVQRKLGQCDGVLIGIALELYRREFGEWPGSLKRLSPGRLPGVPVDRLSGGPLGYRIVEGQPIVYSVGVDGDDDQGRPPMVFGTPTPLNAAPNDVLSINRPLRTNPHYDGDWVIWSTVKGDVE
ncbi:MAG: hypothetical protein GXP26_00200 [Planctomycetes bacterium]|nr:hypothetical protein [Planctomycetota bacterium]